MYAFKDKDGKLYAVNIGGYSMRYYKEVSGENEVEFLTPTLTSNNTVTEKGTIVVTASTGINGQSNWNTGGYMIMLNAVSSTTDVGYWQLQNTTATQWLQIKFPYKIYITGLSFYTRPTDNTAATVQVFTDSTRATAITNALSVSGAVQQKTWTVTPVETDCLYIYVTSPNKYFGMQNLQITGTIKETYTYEIEGTADDYTRVEKYLPLKGVKI